MQEGLAFTPQVAASGDAQWLWLVPAVPMFAAGVNLVDALTSVSGATGNIIYEQATIKIRDQVSTGQQVSITVDRKPWGSDVSARASVRAASTASRALPSAAATTCSTAACSNAPMLRTSCEIDSSPRGSRPS